MDPRSHDLFQRVVSEVPLTSARESTFRGHFRYNLKRYVNHDAWLVSGLRIEQRDRSFTLMRIIEAILIRVRGTAGGIGRTSAGLERRTSEGLLPSFSSLVCVSFAF